MPRTGELEYVFVQTSADGLHSEVHYNHVGAVGNTVETFDERDSAVERMYDLVKAHGVTQRIRTGIILPSVLLQCPGCTEKDLEVTRLERRYLEETKAHDATRHRLECRERELERIRSTMYKDRVEETQRNKEG